MNAKNQSNPKPNAVIGGAILIMVGVLALLTNFVTFPGFLFLLAPGLAFLTWGLLARKTGLIIPSGILSGIATGIYLIEGPLSHLDGPADGAVFLLALAAGFFLVTLFGFYTERGQFVWWPLIPGGILSVIGGMLLSGESGLKALEVINLGWPVILIAIGGYLLLRRKDITQD